MRAKGFTLVEVLITVALIGIVVSAVVSAIQYAPGVWDSLKQLIRVIFG